MNSSSRGFVPIVILVVAVLAIGGGAYYASKSKGGEAKVEADADVAATSSLRALMAQGGNLSCTFTYAQGGVSSSGTVYVAGERMRGDFTATVPNAGAIASHMIKDGEYAYVWSDALPGQGMKMKVTAEQGAALDARAQGSVDFDAPGSYSCERWREDSSKFALPSGVSFVDFTDAAGASAAAAAAIKAQAAGAAVNANVSAGASAKAAQCAACDAVPDAAKAQCRAAVGC